MSALTCVCVCPRSKREHIFVCLVRAAHEGSVSVCLQRIGGFDGEVCICERASLCVPLCPISRA